MAPRTEGVEPAEVQHGPACWSEHADSFGRCAAQGFLGILVAEFGHNFVQVHGLVWSTIGLKTALVAREVFGVWVSV